MTSPLRRKRPITRPSTTRLRKAVNALARAACAVASLAAASPALAELQWRNPGAAAPKSQAEVAQHGGHIHLTTHEEPVTAGGAAHSILVERGVERLAARPEAFDPFEDDALAAAAPMPEPDALQGRAAAFDPFEADDEAAGRLAQTDEMAAEIAPLDVAALQDAFEEPSVEDDVESEQTPSELEQLDAARKAIDEEIMRREIESGVDQEIVAPESAADEEAVESQLPADEGPELEDEIVRPRPSAEEMEDGLLENFGESLDDDQFDLQVGPDGQPFQLTPEQEAERQRLLEEERRLHEQECEELFKAIRQDSIRNISLDIRIPGVPGEDFPLECRRAIDPTFEPRAWNQITYLWKASGLCHKPLYFEQEQLERYGHTAGPVLQPIVSGAHFFGTLPILPYKMGLEPPQECIYTLGHYRPGSCAPYMIQPLGFTWRAAAFQAGAVTGTAFAVP